MVQIKMFDVCSFPPVSDFQPTASQMDLELIDVWTCDGIVHDVSHFCILHLAFQFPVVLAEMAFVCSISSFVPSSCHFDLGPVMRDSVGVFH